MENQKNNRANKLAGRIKNIYSSAAKTIGNIMNGPQKDSEKDPGENIETEQEQKIRKDKEEFEKFINEFKSQSSLDVEPEKLANAINTFQFFEAKMFEINGYDDGLRGVKDRNVEASANIRGTFIYEHCTSMLNGRIKGLKTSLASKDLKLAELTARIEHENRFNQEINLLNKEEHRNFSRPLAWLYIIVGIFLMFADFPISIGISHYFIDLPITDEETFLSKITNPETLLFALGITFLSIYYKLIYDEYVNISIISRKFRQDEEIAKTASEKIMPVVRLFIKLVILIMLLYLLYNIGNVRNALNELSLKSSYPDIVSERQVFDYKLSSFICTTILLPLISGICLSVGFNIFANISNLKKSDEKLQALQEEKKELEKEISTLNTIKDMLMTLQEEWTNNALKIKGLKDLFMNSYLQGFKRGHRAKFNYDLYDNAHSLYIDYLNSKN